MNGAIKSLRREWPWAARSPLDARGLAAFNSLSRFAANRAAPAGRYPRSAWTQSEATERLMFRSQAVAGILSASKPEAAPDRHLPEAAARSDRNATRVDLPSIDPHGTALLLIGGTCLRLDDRARPPRLRPAPSFSTNDARARNRAHPGDAPASYQAGIPTCPILGRGGMMPSKPCQNWSCS